MSILLIYSRLDRIRFKNKQQKKGLEKFVSFLENEMWVNTEQMKDLQLLDKHMRNNFADVSSTEFKTFLADLFKKTGYKIRQKNNNTIDIIATGRNNTINIKIEKSDHKTTEEKIKELIKSTKKSETTIYITTSDFKPEAQKYAETHSITLWNKEDLYKRIEKSFFKTTLINRKVPRNEEFQFYKNKYSARNLKEFIETLETLDPDTLKHHIQKGEFEKWIQDKFKYYSLATAISFRSGKEDSESREHTILTKGGNILKGEILNRVRETIFHDYCIIFGFPFTPHPNRNYWRHIREGITWYPNPNLKKHTLLQKKI